MEKQTRVISGFAILLTLMINASIVSGDTNQRRHLPQFFSCEGQNRDLRAKIEGTLAENQDYFDVILTTSIGSRSEMTSLGQSKSRAEGRFAVQSVNEGSMELLKSSGRTTTLLEISFAPRSLSYIDDGTVFFWQALRCDVVRVSEHERHHPQHQ